MNLSVCTLGCKVNTYESEYIIERFLHVINLHTSTSEDRNLFLC